MRGLFKVKFKHVQGSLSTFLNISKSATRFCPLTHQSQVAVGRGEQAVNLIGPALRPAGAGSPVQDAAQAGQVGVALASHLQKHQRRRRVEQP